MSPVFSEVHADIKLLATSVFISGMAYGSGAISWLNDWFLASTTLPREIDNVWIIGFIVALFMMIIRRTTSPRKDQSYEMPEMVVDGILAFSWPGTLMVMFVAMFGQAPLRHFEAN